MGDQKPVSCTQDTKHFAQMRALRSVEPKPADVGPGKYDIKPTVGGGPVYSSLPKIYEQRFIQEARASPRSAPAADRPSPVHVGRRHKAQAMRELLNAALLIT